MMKVSHYFTASLTAPTPAVLYAVKGDGARMAVARLMAGTEPWTVPEGVTAGVSYTLPDKTPGYYDRLEDGTPACMIAGNLVSAVIAPVLTGQAGAVKASIVLRDADGGQVATFPFQLRVEQAPGIVDAESVPAMGSGFEGKLFYGGPGGALTALELGQGLSVEGGVISAAAGGGGGAADDGAGNITLGAGAKDDGAGNIVLCGERMNELKTITTDKGVYDSFPDQTAREGLRGKLAAPEGLKPGDYLRVKSVSEGGTVTLEGAAAGSGQNAALTTEQIDALHGMFKVCAFVKDDVSAEYNAFKTAFGIGDSGGEEDPDVPDVPVVKTYTVSEELVNVTSNNGATSVNEGASYTATLTASDGYTLEGATVTVTMGGVDITSTAYADGVISIASVTGNVEIIASAVREKTEAALPEDGLIALFDLRNVDMESANKASLPGGGYGIPTATNGEASLFAWGAWVDSTDDYGTTIKRSLLVGAENTTTPIDLGTTYTFIGLTYGGYAGCNHAATSNHWTVNPKYIKSGGSTANVGNNQIVTTNNPGYLAAITRVDGAELTFFTNTTQVAAFDGANYDGFTKWASGANVTVTPYVSSGKFTAFALYNKALTDVEIAEAVAYLKTLEVA